MKQIKFGLIGSGAIGKVHAEIINKIPNAKLIAVAGRDDKHANYAKSINCDYYKDYNEMLKDPDIDAVTICLPSGMHSEATIAAAKAGKHVMCEKPMDTTVEKGQAMIEACRENNVKLGIIFQHRFDEPIIYLKKAIEEGKLGKILGGSAKNIFYRSEEYYGNSWRGTWEFDGGGALINQSIHYIDLLVHILGDAKSVNGKYGNLLHKQIETEDTGIARVEFENGTFGTIEGTTAVYPGLYAQLSIYGEKGAVIIQNDYLMFYHFKDGKWDEFEKILNPDKAMALDSGPEVDRSSHIRQFEDFVEAIIEDKDPAVNGEEGLKSLRLIKAIYKSSDEGKKVYL